MADNQRDLQSLNDYIFCFFCFAAAILGFYKTSPTVYYTTPEFLDSLSLNQKKQICKCFATADEAG